MWIVGTRRSKPEPETLCTFYWLLSFTCFLLMLPWTKVGYVLRSFGALFISFCLVFWYWLYFDKIFLRYLLCSGQVAWQQSPLISTAPSPWKSIHPNRHKSNPRSYLNTIKPIIFNAEGLWVRALHTEDMFFICRQLRFTSSFLVDISQINFIVIYALIKSLFFLSEIDRSI